MHGDCFLLLQGSWVLGFALYLGSACAFGCFCILGRAASREYVFPSVLGKFWVPQVLSFCVVKF